MESKVAAAVARLYESLLASLPSLLGAVALLIVGVLIGAVLRLAVRRLASRVIVRWLGDSRTATVATNSDGQRMVDLVVTVSFWIPVVLAAVMASDVLGLEGFSTWLSAMTKYVPQLLAAVLILVVGATAARFAAITAERLLRPIAGALSGNIGPITRALVLAVSVMIAAEQAGLDLSVLTTFLWVVLAAVFGGATLALAIGSRQSIENILAMHHVRKKVRLTQWIRIDGLEGEVVDLTGTSVELAVNDSIIDVPGTRFVALGFARTKPPTAGTRADA